MTMQMAARGMNGFLLSSDTLMRESVKGNTPSYCSKIYICDKHQIAIAYSGNAPWLMNTAPALRDYLNSLAEFPDFPHQLLEHWGTAFYRNNRMPGEAGSFADLTLVVPRREQWPLLRLRLEESIDTGTPDRPERHGSHLQMFDKLLFSGSQNNAAVFFADYLKAASENLAIAELSRIASLVILSAAATDPNGVGGLEIWTWQQQWKPLAALELSLIEKEYGALMKRVRHFIRAPSLRAK